MNESAICCPLSGGYEDGPSCSTTATPKARKAHRCYECRETIPRGMKYERVSGIWKGSPLRYKTCLSCVEIRTHFTRGPDCEGFYYGQLWPDLEENFFPDMKAGGPCMEGLSPEAKARLFERRLKWMEDSA